MYKIVFINTFYAMCMQHIVVISHLNNFIFPLIVMSL